MRGLPDVAAPKPLHSRAESRRRARRCLAPLRKGQTLELELELEKVRFRSPKVAVGAPERRSTAALYDVIFGGAWKLDRRRV